jgi:hypothetical protein
MAMPKWLACSSMFSDCGPASLTLQRQATTPSVRRVDRGGRHRRRATHVFEQRGIRQRLPLTSWYRRHALFARGGR